MLCLCVSPPQNQFLCLAVLHGTLRVFYDFSGDPKEEVEPKEPDSQKLLVGDADAKTVSLFCSYISSKFLIKRLTFRTVLM